MHSSPPVTAWTSGECHDAIGFWEILAEVGHVVLRGDPTDHSGGTLGRRSSIFVCCVVHVFPSVNLPHISYTLQAFLDLSG